MYGCLRKRTGHYARGFSMTGIYRISIELLNNTQYQPVHTIQERTTIPQVPDFVNPLCEAFFGGILNSTLYYIGQCTIKRPSTFSPISRPLY